MSEDIRAFIAFDIDDEEVVRRLRGVQDRLVEKGANLKMVKPENIHVTMRFLGQVSPKEVEQVYSAMKNVSFSSFKIEIKGLGAFPSLSYIRVIWVGVQKGVEQLKNVFNQLETQLQKLGFKPNNRGFSPHLTIARVRSARNKAKLAGCIEDLENYRFGELEVESLRLKKSVLTPKGPIYSTIHELKAEN